ncbi:MAG: PAS domain-containing protein [Methylobacterium sp.]|uniref:PAS domain-containing protein n=1 Tax=Methylobacterium sp. TaxID=409 RepID=UPI00258D29A4|nr:PAS domain-containing protein [Methylobacterium sp.]MBY0298214.1 PAS domain-containing protein [Methylobacterium sp.]
MQLDFLNGGGPTGALIRTYDWDRSPLGSPDTWPVALQTLVGVMLGSNQPMFVSWGPERTLLYNEGYATILGRKHPSALGQPLLAVWSEIQDGLRQLVERVEAGEPVHMDDISWVLERHGYPEEAHFAFSYTPVRNETGRVAGLFCPCVETTQQVLAERRTVAEREWLGRLFEQAPGFMAMLIGPEHVFEFVNPAYCQLIGHRDVVGQPVRQALPEVEGQGFFELLDRVYATGEPYKGIAVQIGLQRAPGAAVEQRFLDFVYQPVTGADGAVLGIFVEGSDVTDRVQSEISLRDSEERLRISQEAGGIGAFELLPETGEVVVSDQFCRLWGVLPVGRVPVGRFLKLIHPDDREAVMTGRAELPERALDYIEYRIIRPDTGQIRWMARRGEAVTDPSSGRTRYFGISYDISARKQAEAELRALNETLEARVAEVLAERRLFASIVEGTDAFVQVVDPEYRWLAINKAAADEFERIFGVRPAVGRSMLDTLAHLPEHRDAVAVVWGRALAGEEFTEVAEFGDPERDVRSYEMRYRILRAPDGALICAYQFVYDVTERLREQERLRQIEEALRQSQKMEAVGQLTGGLAHDFNNLLTSISGSLELLQTRLAQGRLTDLDRYINAAQGASKRAAALTHRLLAFSRRQTLDPKPTDVNRLVAGMEELIRRTVGPEIAIEVVGAAGLWPTLVDPPQLENALLNLCINARDAMPDGGRITIETANRWLDDRAARERDLPVGQYLSLCVSDTGTGMPPEVIAKAFDPFFTTKPIGEGTGLGLSMIYGFVRQSGGQVRIYSEVGQGTTVCLYLPRHYGEVGSDDAVPDLADAPRAEQGETVLVVDDEPSVRMLVTEVLEDLGYLAVEAADGPSGLKILESDLRIDLMITDVGLPGGMNGRQVADAARVARPDLKVLFITGYAENAAIGNGHLGPGMQVLTKPFVMEVLAARIRAMIKE